MNPIDSTSVLCEGLLDIRVERGVHGLFLVHFEQTECYRVGEVILSHV